MRGFSVAFHAGAAVAIGCVVVLKQRSQVSCEVDTSIYGEPKRLYKAFTQQQNTSTLKSAIREAHDYLQQVKEETGTPGLAVAVSVDGQMVWSEGFGFADVENHVRCIPDSVMRIASISKPLTALAVGQPSSIQDSDSEDWAPSIKLGHNSVKKPDRKRKERYNVIEEKRRRTASAEALIQLQHSCEPVQDIETQVSCDDNEVLCLALSRTTTCTTSTETITNAIQCCEIGTQTDMNADDIKSLEVKLKFLREENSQLKRELKQVCLDEDGLRDKDEKVLFYTGLPSWNLLYCLFNYILPYMSQSSRCTLSPFKRFLLTLIRMRLNLSGKDLAYRFGGIHETTVSRTFLQVIDVLYQRLSPLIYWPERESLLKTLPMDFRKHCPSCVVIIDCFEIFLDRATNPLARAQTYSTYKHHNTVKYLIGITPQGSVSFISDGWGGRVSDKHLTEESGLLDHLLPGDVILADRGFDIQESVGLYCARIKIPAFTKGKKQLSGIEVEQTRRIANVRIHVERVIGNIRKKYGILSATQPIDFAVARNGEKATLDKIVTVGCALTNLCDSVVPFE